MTTPSFLHFVKEKNKDTYLQTKTFLIQKLGNEASRGDISKQARVDIKELRDLYKRERSLFQDTSSVGTQDYKNLTRELIRFYSKILNEKKNTSN